MKIPVRLNGRQKIQHDDETLYKRVYERVLFLVQNKTLHDPELLKLIDIKTQIKPQPVQQIAEDSKPYQVKCGSCGETYISGTESCPFCFSSEVLPNIDSVLSKKVSQEKESLLSDNLPIQDIPSVGEIIGTKPKYLNVRTQGENASLTKTQNTHNERSAIRPVLHFG